MQVQSLSQEDSLEKEVATHFSIFAWETPWTEKSAAAAAAKSLQSCPTLSDPMDCSLPGSSIHGIFQAKVLEWAAIGFSTEESGGLHSPWGHKELDMT